MSGLAIDIQAVKKSFRKNEVLRGMDLQVKRGRTFAFLGRNGAGKTTTIRMLLGLVKRDVGENASIRSRSRKRSDAGKGQCWLLG